MPFFALFFIDQVDYFEILTQKTYAKFAYMQFLL